MKFKFVVSLQNKNKVALHQGAVVACCKAKAQGVVESTFMMFGKVKVQKLVRVAHKIPVGKALDYRRNE